MPDNQYKPVQLCPLSHAANCLLIVVHLNYMENVDCRYSLYINLSS